MIHILIGALLVIGLFIAFYHLLKPYYDARKRHREYSQLIKTVNTLFLQSNPFFIAKEAQTQYSGDSLTYGEISLCSLLDLLALIKPTTHDQFYDLGSGSGKAVIATKLRYPQMEVVGIERVQALHDLAEERGQSVPPPHAVFLCEDFLSADLSHATILLINATAFMPDVWAPLLVKLLGLKAGTKIIITSKQLPDDAFLMRYGAVERMSWGSVNTYIYERR